MPVLWLVEIEVLAEAAIVDEVSEFTGLVTISSAGIPLATTIDSTNDVSVFRV